MEHRVPSQCGIEIDIEVGWMGKRKEIFLPLRMIANWLQYN